MSALRRSGAVATQEEIDAACASQFNVIFNANFEVEDNNHALGWDVQPDDVFISFRTYPSENPAALSGGRSGRVFPAAPGRRIRVSTPVTLCPGEQ